MTDKELIGKLDAMVKALQKAKKKTDKTRILLDARKDFGDEADELMAFFRFLLDPAIVTGLSDAKINKMVTAKPDIDIQYLSCGYLYIMGAGHNTGSDASIATIQNYLHKNPEDEEFLKRLFTKNLPIGVEAATVNKVYGEEIIPVWEVQQGYPIDKVKLKNGTWFSLSQKMNGNRGTMHRGELISRQAQKFKGLDHIKNDLLALYDGDASKRDSWVFDGELIYKNPEGMSDGEAFRYGTGLLNSDNKDKTGIKFVIFDVIPVVEFDRGKCTIPYKIRRIGLNCLRAEITRKHLENIEIVPMVYEGKDQSVIPKWLDYAV